MIKSVCNKQTIAWLIVSFSHGIPYALVMSLVAYYYGFVIGDKTMMATYMALSTLMQFVGSFIGSPQMNFLDGTLKKAGDQFIVDLAGTEVPLPKEKTADGKLDAYVGKTLKVGIRPEDIKDDEEFLEKHPNSHLSAEVEVSELMGAEIYLYLTYQGQNLMARVAPTSKSRRGDKITVAMDTHKIHLFDPETEKTLLN